MADTLTITGPASWASAIINGDFSGLSAYDAQRCETWLEHEQVDGWRIVSVSDDEPCFTWSFRLYGGDASGGEVVDYIAIRATT